MINDENYLSYAAKHYYKPRGMDIEEFYDDMKRFKYIKRLLNKYTDSKDLSDRLILNHLIVIFNVLGYGAGMQLLMFRVDRTHWPILKPFLVFLNALKENEFDGVIMDSYVTDRLKRI
jgi:hypothetical protein